MTAGVASTGRAVFAGWTDVPVRSGHVRRPGGSPPLWPLKERGGHDNRTCNWWCRHSC